MIPLRTETQARSDVGLVRQHNEDRFVDLETNGVWAVADGMGGLSRGDWAASALVEAIRAAPPTEDFDAMLLATADAIRAANAQVMREAESSGVSMGSTIVALVIRGRRFGVLWTGDSRAYLLRARHLYRLSRDHSQVQELVDQGLLTEEGAATHPSRNVLTRAIGFNDPVEIDMIVDDVFDGDVFLLCSDGLHGVLADAEISRFLAMAEDGRGVEAMVDLCLERGAPDNVTVIAVRASEPTLFRVGRPIEGRAG